MQKFVLLRSYRDVDKPSLPSSIVGSQELNSCLMEAHNRREEGPTVTNHCINLEKNEIFPRSSGTKINTRDTGNFRCRIQEP
jgi:hypothetical protein